MATLIDDAFTDTASTALASHTMTGTPAKSWTVAAGTFAIDGSGTKVTETSGTTAFAHAVADAGVADHVTSVSIVIPNTGAYGLGVVVRQSDASNFWVVMVERDASGTPYLQIGDVVATTFTQRAVVNVPGATNSTLTLTTTCSGNSITALVSTSETCNYGSASFNNTATKVGIMQYTAFSYPASTMDDFLVTGSSGSPVGPLTGGKLVGNGILRGRLVA